MGWIAAPLFLLRALVLCVPAAASFVVVTALAAGSMEGARGRLALGAIVTVALPLLAWWRADRWRRRPSAAFFVATWNVLMTAALAFGFADDVGTALRRHGDWFLGEREGAVAASARAVVASAAALLESFTPLPELRPVVTFAEPPPIGPVEPPHIALWFHPLAGPRQLPRHESRRFGAARPQPRPPECELGHCGVDLGSTVGEPVFAVHDAVVEKILRDDRLDPHAGRYVILSHLSGRVRSRYLHLDEVRPGLQVGDLIVGGEVIGRLGRTGIFNSGPHLHFGLEVASRYVDPEPYLRDWALPEAPPARLASLGGR